MQATWSSKLTSPAARVSLGTGAYGLAQYIHLTIAGQLLGVAGYSAFGSFYTLLNALALGLFIPLEQEASRVSARASATGENHRPAIKRASQYAAWTSLILAAAMALGHGYITRTWFEGSATLLVLLIAAIVGQAVAYLTRGMLSGQGNLNRYALQFTVDAGVRVVGTLLFAATGVDSVSAFASLFVLAPIIAVGASSLPTRVLWHPVNQVPKTSPQPADAAAQSTGPASGQGANPQTRPADVPLGSLTWLVVTSMGCQILANIGPPTVGVLSTEPTDTVTGPLTAGTVLTRIPLFLFSVVQALLLPALARRLANEDLPGFRRILMQTLAGTTAGAALGVAIFAVLGPWGVRVLFGSEFVLTSAVTALLAASGGLFMMGQVFAQGLLALHRERFVAAAWCAGLLGYLIALVIPGDLALRISLALTLGTGLGAATMAFFFVRAMSQQGTQTLISERSTGSTR